MEPDRSDQPPMEVLDPDRPPSALAEWLARVFQRPLVRVGGVLVVALALVGGWLVTSDEPPPRVEAQDAGPFISPLFQTPAPTVPSRGSDPWRVTQEPQVTFVPGGRVVSFSAVNEGSRPRDPSELFVHVGYVSGGASAYIFPCAGVGQAAEGQRRVRGLVRPGSEVVLACEDTLQLNGKPSRLPPEVLSVVAEEG